MNRKNPLIILAGPTAVGKTALSVELARRIGGEIISADSMQMYRGLDIGSAKISREEMGGIPHHLIDVLDPTAECNVVLFQQMAKEAIQRVYRAGHIPIIVGGTGFYIQAVLYDIDFTENAEDAACRIELEALAREKGALYLHDRLREVDAASAEDIHPNNVRRVIRALEFYHQTGTPISVHNAAQRRRTSPYDAFYAVLYMDRDRLYARINLRVDQMMEKGLLDEVRRLRDAGCRPEMTSMQGLGYKELLHYLNHGGDLEEVIADIKENTRHFAKRQLTWFRREHEAHWINAEQQSTAALAEQIQGEWKNLQG